MKVRDKYTEINAMEETIRNQDYRDIAVTLREEGNELYKQGQVLEGKLCESLEYLILNGRSSKSCQEVL